VRGLNPNRPPALQDLPRQTLRPQLAAQVDANVTGPRPWVQRGPQALAFDDPIPAHRFPMMMITLSTDLPAQSTITIHHPRYQDPISQTPLPDVQMAAHIITYPCIQPPINEPQRPDNDHNDGE
jgi:hypothetical protein